MTARISGGRRPVRSHRLRARGHRYGCRGGVARSRPVAGRVHVHDRRCRSRRSTSSAITEVDEPGPDRDRVEAAADIVDDALGCHVAAQCRVAGLRACSTTRRRRCSADDEATTTLLAANAVDTTTTPRQRPRHRGHTAARARSRERGDDPGGHRDARGHRTRRRAAVRSLGRHGARGRRDRPADPLVHPAARAVRPRRTIRRPPGCRTRSAR